MQLVFEEFIKSMNLNIFGHFQKYFEMFFPLILNKPNILKENDIRLRGRYRRSIFSHLTESYLALPIYLIQLQICVRTCVIY